MKTLLRRLRGALGNGLVWSVAWVVARIGVLGVGVLASGLPLDMFMSLVVPVAISAAVVGFMSGVSFSVMFSAVNHRRLLGDVRPVSTGLLGAAAGILFPVAQFGAAAAMGIAMPPLGLVINVLVGASLGSATAVGSLRLARADEARRLEAVEHELLLTSSD